MNVTPYEESLIDGIKTLPQNIVDSAHEWFEHSAPADYRRFVICASYVEWMASGIAYVE